MAASDHRPQDVAKRLAARRDELRHSHGASAIADSWRRDTFRLSRSAAREKARDLFTRFPKAAYMTEIEWWRECENGDIEFTIRRRHSAD